MTMLSFYKRYPQHLLSRVLIYFVILSILFFPFSAQQTYAQQGSSQCVITKVGTPNASPTIPANCNGSGAPGVCGQAPQTTFSSAEQYANQIRIKWDIYFIGMDLDQLQMIWEEFHMIDCVGFLQDLRGTKVARWYNDFSQQFSCPQDPDIDVQFGNHNGPFVRALITHELTHVWQNCSPNGINNLLDIPAAYSGEGGLTNYSRTGCGFSVNLHNEDHADTIALWLNADSGELTCNNGNPNPFAGGAHPLHKGVALKGVPKK